MQIFQRQFILIVCENLLKVIFYTFLGTFLKIFINKYVCNIIVRFIVWLICLQINIKYFYNKQWSGKLKKFVLGWLLFISVEKNRSAIAELIQTNSATNTVRELALEEIPL